MCNFLSPQKYYSVFPSVVVVAVVGGHQLSIIGAQTTNNLSLRRGPPAGSASNNSRNGNGSNSNNKSNKRHFAVNSK